MLGKCNYQLEKLHLGNKAKKMYQVNSLMIGVKDNK